MSRRSAPERIDQARRAATRNRLIGEGVTEATADAWIAAWEAQMARDWLERGSAYWAWIADAAGAPGEAVDQRVGLPVPPVTLSAAGRDWVAVQWCHRVRQ